MTDIFEKFNQVLTTCRLCPRLVAHRETVALRPPLNKEPCWRRPVPGFGDPNGWLLILGLAPSPQGGNRTGRIFTGDKSAVFLMESLYANGLCNQPFSISRDDGLMLNGCYVTAAVKCVPPMHRPTTEEAKRCINTYLIHELDKLANIRAVLALGKLAFDAYFAWVKAKQSSIKKPHFSHGVSYEIPFLPKIYGSYHPSPQNTNTGKLTREMFNNLLGKIILENK
ncbi:MAG: uracil-DNA glycosylase [Parachlamydiaceae bacterium]